MKKFVKTVDAFSSTNLWFHEISDHLMKNIKHDLLIFSEYTIWIYALLPEFHYDSPIFEKSEQIIRLKLLT